MQIGIQLRVDLSSCLLVSVGFLGQHHQRAQCGNRPMGQFQLPLVDLLGIGVLLPWGFGGGEGPLEGLQQIQGLEAAHSRSW